MPARNSRLPSCALVSAAFVLADPSAAATQVEQQTPVADSRPEEGQVTAVHSVEIRGVFDFRRATTDPEYGRVLLEIFDAMAAQEPAESARRAGADALRAAVMAAMGRREESASIVDGIVARGFQEPLVYGEALTAAQLLDDGARMLVVIEAAARNVPPAQHGALHSVLASDVIFVLDRWYGERGDRPSRVRLADALVRIGWPGDGEPHVRDNFRLRMVDEKLANGDRSGGGELARQVAAPAWVLRLLALKRYDGLLPVGADRSEGIRRAIAGHDRATARALEARPDDRGLILSRVQFLLAVGRAGDALTILQPFLDEIEETVAGDPRGPALIDQAAYALLLLGRATEGEALLSRMADIPLEVQPSLLDANINYSSFLWQAGRFEAALRHAEHVARDFAAQTNDFGRMWNWSAMACALAGLERDAEARRVVEQMRPLAHAGMSALMRAYLCLEDLQSAEAMMLSRLRAEDADDAVIALQNWQIGETPTGPNAVAEARLSEIRARPAIAEALGRRGYVLDIPMTRTFWGAY